MARLLRTAIFMACILSAGSAFVGTASAQHTYYVSKSTGLDSRSSTQAQSKSTPWAHLPGMKACASNCGSYSPVAGDSFILMGCDVWGASDLPIDWDWSGTPGNPITIGVDKTWFNTTNCPSSWNRPVLDSGQTSVGWYFRIAGTSNNIGWGVLDNIEMKNLVDDRYLSCYNSCHDWTWSNLYLHAWHIVTDGNCKLVVTAASSPNVTFTNSVVDGSDATGASPAGGTCYFTYSSVPKNITNNVIHDLANGIVAGAISDAVITISGNQIYNIIESNAGSHPNAIETQGGASFIIHDNVIHDHVGESAFLGGAGELDYVYNNVWYNILGNPPEVETRNGAWTGNWYNNTIVFPTCIYQTGSGATTQHLINNHCIGTNMTNGGSGFALTTNLVQSLASANSQGYTSSEAYPYSPVNGSGSTINFGTNLSSSCSGNLAGLCSDTTVACMQQAIKGVVQAVCPMRTAVARPSSGASDVGAYQFSSSTAQAPQPPTGLKALAQ